MPYDERTAQLGEVDLLALGGHEEGQQLHAGEGQDPQLGPQRRLCVV